MSKVLLREMTWKEVEALVGPDTVVIVPTGATEQHGQHLPLEVDSCIVEEVARRAAELVASQIRVIVAPTVPFGVSGYHMSFPGTLTLSMQTFLAVVEEICESLIHHGFRRILILNGHGGNHDPIKIAARNIADRTGVAVAAASYWNIAADELAPFQDSEVDAIPGHACGFETACMLLLRPSLVDKEAMISTSTVVGQHGYLREQYFKKRLQWREPKVQLPQQVGVVGPFGWAGDPTKGTEEKGRRYVEIIVEQLARFLVHFADGEFIRAPFAFSFSQDLRR